VSTTAPSMTIPVRSESDPEVVYTVTIGADGATCSCPAATYRPGPCKHAAPILADIADVAGEAPAWQQPTPTAAPSPAPALADEHLAAQRALEADPADAAARQAARAVEWAEHVEAIAEPDSDTAGVAARIAKALGGWGVAVTEELAQLAREVGLQVIPPTVAEVEAAAAEFAACCEAGPSLGSIAQRHNRRARYLEAMEAGLRVRARATAGRNGCTTEAYEAALAELMEAEHDRRRAADGRAQLEAARNVVAA